MSSIKIEQWPELTDSFEAFFRSIDGDVERSKEHLCFISASEKVETSLTLYRNGTFAAAMPLHGIDAKVERVVFQPDTSEIHLLGKDVNYVYRVPPQLLTLQGE
jgi:hypothetical protein|tara:strand:+ start:338 stop:649 length:312 start_codon:yes stop_codon:yes gene_type:complete